MFFKKSLYKKFKKELETISVKKQEYLQLHKDDSTAYALVSPSTDEEILGYIASGISLNMGLDVREEQFIAALSLINGKVIEMSTGEGKTLVGYLFAFHQLTRKKQVFIVTVNDYLVERDASGLKSLLKEMGRDDEEVTFITNSTPHSLRIVKYNRSKVVYISSQQLMFDNLKNKMASSTQDYYNLKFESILLDEADLILLDESQNPFIIAGEDDSHDDEELHTVLEFVKTKLKPYLEITKETKQVSITDEGYDFLEQNGYDILDYQTLARISHSNRALFLFEKNVDYVVSKGKIQLIDSYTGRILEGRRLQDGLHQFLEAKENVEIQNENRTIRSMTYPHFFSKFNHFVGMSGTLTEAKDELNSIYGLTIEVIPTHKPSQLQIHEDKIYETKEDKVNGLVSLIKEKSPQPILIVTTNIEDTFVIEEALKKENISSQTLNAYNEEIEGQIIEKAGTYGTVTIATNMAGRGTDIHVDEESLAIGGLLCVGFEHNQTSRIDRQLIGRTGRNGNPGEALFLTALTDTWIPLMHEEYNQVIESVKTNEKKLRKTLKEKMEINDGFFKQYREQENKIQGLYGIHRDLLYAYRDKALHAQNFNELVDIVNNFMEISIAKTDEAVEIYQMKKQVLKTFDSIIPEYLSQAEQLKHNIQFFQNGADNPFNLFERLLIDTFESMKQSFFKDLISYMETFVVFEKRKASINHIMYLSPSESYTYLHNHDGSNEIHYKVESFSEVLLEEKLEVNKEGLLELYIGQELKQDNYYILTFYKDNEISKEVVLYIFESEYIEFNRSQVLSYYAPSTIHMEKKENTRIDYVVFNSSLEIVEVLSYATIVQINEKTSYKKGSYKLTLIVDNEIRLIQNFKVL